MSKSLCIGYCKAGSTVTWTNIDNNMHTVTSGEQNQSENQKQDLILSNLVSNFPFKEIRPKQFEVLQRIAEAINKGYKYIVLEAPTGFGKSPVAIAVGRTSGTSYICSATKDLQTQYTNDFPFLSSRT